jgi:hypothetical protein
MRHREYISAFPPSFSPHGKMFLQEKDLPNERIRTAITIEDPDPDPSFLFNADPDPTFQFDANPDPTFHFNADPDPAPHLRPLIYRPSRVSF